MAAINPTKKTLTEQEGIVTQVDTPKPITGRTIVVFRRERGNQSRTLIGVYQGRERRVEPGKLQKLLGRTYLECLSVTTRRQNHHHFSRDFPHSNQTHGLKLTFDFHFDILSPETLCTYLEDDPLKVCEELIETIGRALMCKPWERLISDSDFETAFEETLKEEQNGTTRRLQVETKAAEVGLDLTWIQCARHFRVREVAVDRTRVESKVSKNLTELAHEKERHKIQLQIDGDREDEKEQQEHDHLMRIIQAKNEADAIKIELENERVHREFNIDMEHQAETRKLERRLMASAVEALGKALDNIGEDMYNLTDLKKALKEIVQIRYEFEALHNPRSESPRAQKAAGMLSDENAPNEDRCQTIKLLGEIRRHIKQSFSTPEEKQQILGEFDKLEDALAATDTQEEEGEDGSARVSRAD